MMNKYKQIMLLSLRHPLFLIVGAIFIASCSGYHFFLKYGIQHIPMGISVALADDIATVLTVFGLWLPFVLGVLLKQQFASFRASLLPRYRSAHLCVGLVLYALFLAFGSLATVGVGLMFRSLPDTMIWGVYISFWLMTIYVVYLGYISLAGLLISSYVIGIVFLANVKEVIPFLCSSFEVIAGTFTASVVLLLILGSRLMKLKEDHLEYPFLISWPQKDFIQNQLRLRQMIGSWIQGAMKALHIKSKSLVVPMYPRAAHSLKRAWHWEYIEFSELKSIIIFLIIALPLYILYLSHWGRENAYLSKAFSNFLLFAVAPVFIVLAGNYNKLPYWGYDLLRPVSRGDYLKERGIVLITNLCIYWFLLFGFFGLLPKLILDASGGLPIKFWGFSFMTAAFAYMLLAWFAMVSRYTSTRLIVIHGLILSMIASLQFMHASQEPALGLMLINSCIYCIQGFVMARIAYRFWLEAEF